MSDDLTDHKAEKDSDRQQEEPLLDSVWSAAEGDVTSSLNTGVNMPVEATASDSEVKSSNKRKVDEAETNIPTNAAADQFPDKRRKLEEAGLAESLQRKSVQNDLATETPAEGKEIDAEEVKQDSNPAWSSDVKNKPTNSDSNEVQTNTQTATTENLPEKQNGSVASLLDLSKDKDTKVLSSKPHAAMTAAISEVKQSGDSDKENIMDGPMDLSKAVAKSCGSSGSSDVIMLSDEDENGLMNGVTNSPAALPPDKVRERKRLVRHLQECLRNEETKLVLLKKIRQSQLMQTLTENTPSSSSSPASSQSNSSKSAVARPQGAHNQPPPLVRQHQQNQPSQQAPAGNQLRQHSSNLLLNRTAGSSHHQSSSHMRSSHVPVSQGPPPLVGSRHPTTPTQASNHVQRNNFNPQFQQRSQPPAPPAQPEQTPAQRQAAAKLALRKQLEKTLLQIPPPKPPPPEMNFIPSLAGNDFIPLVGLEEVVKCIMDADSGIAKVAEKSTDVKYVFNPFVCVQCGTDFTPVWKRDKPGSKNVICEHCVTTNQKKALKQEHTNRLKSAFVKALQQEQEIEQRMQAQSSSSSSSSTSGSSSIVTSAGSASSSSSATVTTAASTASAPTSSHHSHHHHQSTQRSSSSASAAAAAAAATAAAASPINLSTAYKATSEQFRHHQSLLQAHQAQLRGAPPLGLQAFNPRLAAFQFQQPLNNKAAADIQRQYLLDMIPRSLPGGTVLWRT